VKCLESDTDKQLINRGDRVRLNRCTGGLHSFTRKQCKKM